MKSPGAITLELILNTVSVSMELDTVAALSLINTTTYHKIRQLTTRSLNQVNYLSRNPDIMLRIYTGEHINVHGSAEVEIYHEEKAKVLMLQVIEREGPNLLGRGWWNTLLVRLNGVCNLVGTIDKYVDEMLTKHIKVFSNELGTLTDYKAKLNVDSTVMPKFCKAGKVPYTLKPLVESELNRLESEGIVSPVQFHTGQHQLYL